MVEIKFETTSSEFADPHFRRGVLRKLAEIHRGIRLGILEGKIFDADGNAIGHLDVNQFIEDDDL